ncbi:hypothetical protein COOONC_05621 [Cooperia oncophora]
MLMSAIALAHQPAAVVGVDIDGYALSICRGNLEELEIDHCCDLIKADVLQIPDALHGHFDIVIMNPPFGTKKNEGNHFSYWSTLWQTLERQAFSQ